MKKLFVVMLIVVVLLGLAAIIDSINKDKAAQVQMETPNSEVETAPVYIEQRDASQGVVTISSPAFTRQIMYVLGDYVNRREQTNTDSAVLGYYLAGETVEVTGKSGDWYEIAEGGYIREDLLTDNYDDIVPHFLETYQDLIVTHISHGQRTEYWYYGKCIASGDCVTGDAHDHPTPIGLYYITSKQTDIDMYGDPDLHADYFCAFNGLIGYHNAPWRQGSFGGTIYKGAGSHGCINCPDDLAKAIYDHCSVNYTYVLILP